MGELRFRAEVMAMAPQCRLRLTWFLALLCAVTASAPANIESTFDDGVLDDLSVEDVQDPDGNGQLYHQDTDHMAPEDVQQASKVFDVLFPSYSYGDLGESDNAQATVGAAKENLDEARKARSEATKTLLAAKGGAATKQAEKQLKKAEQGVEKAKENVVGKDEFKKEEEQKVEKKLEKAKDEERSARKKILKAKGLEATEEATKEMEKAKAKVEKDKKKAEALGVKKGDSPKSAKGRSKKMKKDVFKDKMKKKLKKEKKEESFKARAMAKANEAMKEFLPKTSTYVKSRGNKPMNVKIVPGSKETKGDGSTQKEGLKEAVSNAKDLRNAAQKALVKSKSGSEKRAAEKPLPR